MARLVSHLKTPHMGKKTRESNSVQPPPMKQEPAAEPFSAASELLQLERALGVINSTQLVAAQPPAVGFLCLESFKALQAGTQWGAEFTQVMVNCSWEERVAEVHGVGQIQKQQISCWSKGGWNEMQPTLMSSSMGGAELLGSRKVTHLVSTQRKVASFTPFLQQGRNGCYHPDLLIWLLALSKGLCTCSNSYR